MSLIMMKLTELVQALEKREIPVFSYVYQLDIIGVVTCFKFEDRIVYYSQYSLAALFMRHQIVDNMNNVVQ